MRVAGARLTPPAQPSLKIEGATLRGYRSITLAGIRDPETIAHIDELERGVQDAVTSNMAGTVSPNDYSLRLLRYGLDAVTGQANGPAPEEVGLVIEAIAPTQELADAVLALARSTALHQPFEGRKATAGNLAFPFSPSDFRGGPVYEFAVYHLMAVDDPDALFPVQTEQI